MTSAQVVAGEVRAALARERFSGRKAALELGWTPPYLSRRLTGEIPFDVADLQAIADLLGLPITVFFEQPAAVAAATARGSRNQLREAEGVASGRQVRKSAKPDYLLRPVFGLAA